jgi:hypothetical protein
MARSSAVTAGAFTVGAVPWVRRIPGSGRIGTGISAKGWVTPTCGGLPLLTGARISLGFG